MTANTQLRKMVRPTLATVLAIILVVSVILTVVSPPRVSAVVPGANGKIAFESQRDGNEEVYVMNADGSGQTRLTYNDAEDSYPTWQSIRASVGGVVIPANNFAIVAPWLVIIGLVGCIGTAIVVAKKRQS
jgi:TolB protein